MALFTSGIPSIACFGWQQVTSPGLRFFQAGPIVKVNCGSLFVLLQQARVINPASKQLQNSNTFITSIFITTTDERVKTMRHLKMLALAGLLSAVSVAPAMAGDMYFGAKTGPMVIDDSAIKTDPTNVGILVGYELGVVVGDLAVEGEFTTTTSDGKEKYSGQKVDIDTIAAYLAFRTAGPIYFKAKGGVLQEDVSVGSNSETDSGASYGVGIGFGIGIAQLELEYTQVEADVGFLSVGVQF
jgi:hypothetical protein